MSLLRRAVLRVTTSVIATALDLCVSYAKGALKRRERVLCRELATLLGKPRDLIVVKLTTFVDGSTLAAIELKWAVSQKQLTQAQEFLDGVDSIRQNVRSPSPMVN